MKTMINVEHLTKQYQEVLAVDDLSFRVYEGEIVGLLGPNGSGKSTTINCLLSLLNFNNGTIELFDKKMKPDAYDLKAQIGVIFQEVAVFDELTVYENINSLFFFLLLNLHMLAVAMAERNAVMTQVKRALLLESCAVNLP